MITLRLWMLGSIGVLGLALLYGCQQTAPKQEGNRPNIILIMADDLGYETLGCYGGQSYSTPNLDRLAANGMRFDYCYSTPLCTPSRVQLMTGKYNFRNYIGFGLLDPAEKTFGHLMKDAGYKTCVVGKWQLYGNARQRELAGRGGTLPRQAGFDSWCLWQVKDRGFRYKDPLLDISDQGLVDFPGEYGPDIFTSFLENFMQENQDRPFFAYFPMCLTHDPFQPSSLHSGFDQFDSQTGLNDTTYFSDMVGKMDQIIGRIAAKADELGIRENTLILFIGDNGTDRKVISTWRDRRIKGHKGYTTEAGTHVPFIANWPGTIKAKQVNPDLVDFTDFLPSLLEAAVADLPQDFLTDGQSFYPTLTGGKQQPREWIFCHYDPRWGKFEQSRYVQDKSWKLYSDSSFYNIATDPTEMNVLIREELNPRAEAALIKLTQALASFQ